MAMIGFANTCAFEVTRRAAMVGCERASAPRCRHKSTASNIAPARERQVKLDRFPDTLSPGRAASRSSTASAADHQCSAANSGASEPSLSGHGAPTDDALRRIHERAVEIEEDLARLQPSQPESFAIRGGLVISAARLSGASREPLDLHS